MLSYNIFNYVTNSKIQKSILKWQGFLVEEFSHRDNFPALGKESSRKKVADFLSHTHYLLLNNYNIFIIIIQLKLIITNNHILMIIFLPYQYSHEEYL